ncbi:MAG: hypothetical protein ABFD16_31365 [Thermoguttaceae bacterium]
MAEAFDPYRQWLGIQDPQRPPNLYHLVGVERFEQDLIAIANAADRQMAQVRNHQAGQQAEEAQRLFQELISAKLCLLDPKRKADYDALLRAQMSGAYAMPAPTPASPPTEYQAVGYNDGYLAVPQPVPQATEPDTGLTPATKIVIGSLSGAILLLLVLIVWLTGSRTPPPSEPSTQVAAGTKPEATTKPSSAPAKPATAAKPETKVNPSPTPPKSATSSVLSAPLVKSDDGLPPKQPSAEVMPAVQPEPSKPAFPAATQPARAADALLAARIAMAKRDLIAAAEQLDLASSLVTAAELSELNRLKELLGSLGAFWRAVRSGMAELKPGETLDVTGRKLLVTSATTEDLVVRSGTQEVRFTIANLPPALALVLCERKLANQPSAGVLKATFLVFDPRGDKRLARQWCDQAAQDGLSVAALLAELGPASEAAEKPAKTPKQVSSSPKVDASSKTPSKPPIPEAAAQAAALAEVRKIHRDELDKAQEPAKKKALARSLLKEAAETQDEPVIRYVLLGQARDLAVSVGDSELLRDVLDETAKYYDVNAQEQLIAILNDVAESRIGTGGKKELARGALEAAEECIVQHDYDAALKLARAAQGMALGRDTTLSKQAGDLAKTVPRLRQEYERFQQAAKVLADDPNNTAANLAQGKYYCLVQNTPEAWKKGLPMLAKGNDEKLKTLAEAELALSRSKPAAGDMFNLAEQWYDVARSGEDSAQESFRGRAAFWYKKAIPNLQGFKEKKAKLRLSELQGN